MNSLPGRFSHFYWVVGIVGLASILGGAALIGLGVVGFPALVNVPAIVGGVLAVAVGVLAMSLIAILIKMESNSARQLGLLRDMVELMEKELGKIDQIVANTEISDSAKSLVHRAHELDSLRQAIRDEVRREDWEAARHLVHEMERRFGYKQEAQQLRDEITEAKRETMESRLQEALSSIDGHCNRYEWDLARQEVDRLVELLPEDPRVRGLPDRLAELQSQRKEALLAEWRAAAGRSEIDQAIEILKDLDYYLAPEEARALEESARTVFKEKLLQLGVRFRFAVTEKRWHDALEIGAELIREFPNARMASEVRDRLDILRERAKHQDQTGTDPVPASTSRGR